jgi:outer membrane biogenesis lipoprotein LolB
MNSVMKVLIFLLSGLFCFQLNACTQENNIQPDNNQNEIENTEINGNTNSYRNIFFFS